MAQEQRGTEAEALPKADRVLREKLSEIHTVSEWADLLGFKSDKTFSRKYRNKKGKRPKHVLIKTKLDRALYLLKNNSGMSCYEVAQEIGKKDEKALNFFFKTHLGMSPTESKIRSISKERK